MPSVVNNRRRRRGPATAQSGSGRCVTSVPPAFTHLAATRNATGTPRSWSDGQPTRSGNGGGARRVERSVQEARVYPDVPREGYGNFRPNSKRQSVVELPRLRLPLPERTGSDRDELLCPHGFVDRAYSVFLLRCVATNLCFYCTCYRGLRCVVSPLVICFVPGSSALRWIDRGVNEGTSPRAPARPTFLLRASTSCAATCSGRGPATARRWRCPTCARRSELQSPHSPSGGSVQACGSRLRTVTTRIRDGHYCSVRAKRCVKRPGRRSSVVAPRSTTV